MADKPPHTVRVGVYMPRGSQLLDMACVDVLHMMSREYLGGLGLIPPHVAAVAPSVQIYYITNKANMAAAKVPLTASVVLVPTHELSDPSVAAGTLDVVLIPGADPAEEFPEEEKAWLEQHMATEETDVLSVCTGIYLCGQAGILKGRSACGPRGLQGDLKGKFPDTKFVGDKYRWWQDGNFWSCGGITNGNELVAAYARHSKHFPDPIAEIGIKMAEVGTRPQEYEQGNTQFTIAFVWQVLRSWFSGPGYKSKKL